MLDICAGRLSRRSAGVGVGEERIEASREGGRVSDGEGAATSDEVNGLAKLAVVGAEEHGDAVDRSLGGVVDTVAEAAADVGDAGVAVDGREEAEGVDDEAVDARSRVGISAGEAQGRTGETGLNGGEVRLVDLVRSEDELQVEVRVEIGDQQCLVLATSYRQSAPGGRRVQRRRQRRGADGRCGGCRSRDRSGCRP